MREDPLEKKRQKLFVIQVIVSSAALAFGIISLVFSLAR